jgi:hypothetical protein
LILVELLNFRLITVLMDNMDIRYNRKLSSNYYDKLI